MSDLIKSFNSMTYPEIVDIKSQVLEGIGELGLEVLVLLHDPEGFVQLDDLLVELCLVVVAHVVYRN